MRKPDRGTLRAAGHVALLTVVFLVVNTAVAAAADNSGPAQSSGLLAPLNVTTSEGVPLNAYRLDADSGDITNLSGQTQTLLLGGMFTLVRLLVGLSCWLIEFAFKFPLITSLLRPAQRAANAYNTHVVGALGLKGLLLGWAFIFGLILFMRGKVGQGLGEIILTLLIAAFAASAFIRPDCLLAPDGPLDQSHQASLEVAQITTDSYFHKTSGTGSSCDLVAGPAKNTCDDSAVQAKRVARPLQDALTNALIVKPYQLLEYGRILDPNKDADAYKIHLKWIKNGYKVDGDKSYCKHLPPTAKRYCNGERNILPWSDKHPSEFTQFTSDLSKAGDAGKAAADYAKTPSWDRVGAVLLLLVAVAVITLMVCSMTMVLIGTQGADVGAAAVGGIAWVWGMLPGPSRMAVWRWFGVYIVSVMVMFVAAMALPMFGIAVDAALTGSGADLMVERLLLLDALAITFLAFHRRLMGATSQFGQRLALRMRYAKIGGTHLPGDSSELGAALAMNGPGGGGGSQGLLAGPSGAHAAFGARLGSLAALADGTGMPFQPGRLLGEALAEGRRGFAPAALALRGAHAALIGPRPAQEDESVKLLRTIAHGEPGTAGGTGSGSGNGKVSVNKETGELLHDPDIHRPLLGSRIHQRASRFRGYRIAARAGRFGYGATIGLPRNLKSGRAKASQFTEDAQTQLRVAANQVREDAAEWAPVGRAAMAGGRYVSQTVDHQSQRLATAWQVHDPAQAARTFARDTAAGAAMYVSPSTVGDPGPHRETTQTRAEDPGAVNRRQVFDALMRLQRQTWDTPPSWGGENE